MHMPHMPNQLHVPAVPEATSMHASAAIPRGMLSSVRLIEWCGSWCGRNAACPHHVESSRAKPQICSFKEQCR